MNDPWATWGTQADPRRTAGEAYPAVRGMPAAKVILALLLLLACLGLVACESTEDGAGGVSTSSTVEESRERSGDIQGRVGEEIRVGNATITVRALEATFQPAMPEQRLSEEAPSAPGVGESFYQAYLRVGNGGTAPIRVDAADFYCAVGESVVGIEPTRSGPSPRSLLRNASLDLVLTFKARAGFEPLLIYRPPWHVGTITISPKSEEGSTSTTR